MVSADLIFDFYFLCASIPWSSSWIQSVSVCVIMEYLPRYFVMSILFMSHVLFLSVFKYHFFSLIMMLWCYDVMLLWLFKSPWVLFIFSVTSFAVILFGLLHIHSFLVFLYLLCNFLYGLFIQRYDYSHIRIFRIFIFYVICFICFCAFFLYETLVFLPLIPPIKYRKSMKMQQ